MQVQTIAANSKGLRALLNPQRLTEICDIGANPIDGLPPYKAMLDEGLCRLTGFEPQEEALAKLLGIKGPNETYLPHAVGDGLAQTLRLYQNTGLVSLLELDPATLEIFRPYNSALKGEAMISTKRLDDIEEIRHLDFLKIDIQGGELSVFQNGRRMLSNAVAIQTEVSFVPLYKHQPCIGDIDIELRSQGFIPHCFAAPEKKAPIGCLVFGGDRWRGMNQLLEVDMVYVRDFRKPDNLSDEMLKHLAMIANCCYRSVDLVHYCLEILIDRGEVAPDACERYLNANLGGCAGNTSA